MDWVPWDWEVAIGLGGAIGLGDAMDWEGMTKPWDWEGTGEALEDPNVDPDAV